MPIRPENKGKYPPNWGEIRRRILARSGQRCERCGVRNHGFVIRDGDMVLGEFTEACMEMETLTAVDGFRAVWVVLTVAHLDHDATNNSEKNLAALCQRCHLRHDADQHRRSRSANVYRDRESAGQLNLLTTLEEKE